MNDTTQQFPVFHPTRKLYRYTLLLFVSLLTFGSYFALKKLLLNEIDNLVACDL